MAVVVVVLPFKVFYFLTFTKQCSKILPNQFSTIFICDSHQINSYILLGLGIGHIGPVNRVTDY
jgi:hypothetical protein